MSDNPPPIRAALLAPRSGLRLPTMAEGRRLAAGELQPAQWQRLDFTPGMLALPSLPAIREAEHQAERRRPEWWLDDARPEAFAARWLETEQEALSFAFAARPLTLTERVRRAQAGLSAGPRLVDALPMPSGERAGLWWRATADTLAALPRNLGATAPDPGTRLIAATSFERAADLARQAADETARTIKAEGPEAPWAQSMAGETGRLLRHLGEMAGGWQPQVALMPSDVNLV